jgi:hypothetical protein
MGSLHCDADTGGGIVALCAWAAHVLRNDASVSLPLAAACSDGSASRCLEYLHTGRMYSSPTDFFLTRSPLLPPRFVLLTQGCPPQPPCRYASLLSALGGPTVPPSPAAAVALVSHLSNMRNDSSRLRAAAAVVAAGGLTASGHLRLLEAAACAGVAQSQSLIASTPLAPFNSCADAFRNAPVAPPRDIEDCLLEWLCYCQAHFSESIGGTLPALLANDDLLLDCAGKLPPPPSHPAPPLPLPSKLTHSALPNVSDGIAIFCILAVHAPWTRPVHQRMILQPSTLSHRLSNLHIVLALCTKMKLPVFLAAEQLAAPRPQ